MSSPRDHLPVYVQYDIARYQSYGWNPRLILDIIYRRHAYRLSANCLKALKNQTECPHKCTSHCWIKRMAHPTPNPEWLKELQRKTVFDTALLQFPKK